MNLLKNRKKNLFFEYINPISIRQYQYNFISAFCENAINFLSNQRDNYISIHSITLDDRINFQGVNNSKYTKLKIEIKNNINGEINTFTEFFIPTLIHNNHFYLNGCYYTPILYLIDYPITIKKKSCKIFSLFNSITLFINDDIAIFVNHHLALDYFLQLFVDFDDPIYQEYIKYYKLAHKKQEMNNIIEVLSKRFSVKNKTKEDVINKFESIFFDKYTYSLYQKCYGLTDFGLVDIIRQALINSVKPPDCFTDLNNKRITFLEMLLRPFLNRICSLCIEIGKGNYKTEMKVDPLLIIKYFLKSKDSNLGNNSIGLSGNYLYDTKNLYSGILINKCSFISPNMDRPPTEIKHLHYSHYKKICPITISAQTPGETISLIPTTKLDEFGLFI